MVSTIWCMFDSPCPSELHSRPKLCENPILGATLGATLGIGWTPIYFSPNSRSIFCKDAALFAYSWKLLAYSGAFLLAQLAFLAFLLTALAFLLTVELPFFSS